MPGKFRVMGKFPPLRLPSADTHGLRLAHHAARLGTALAFCDRCPCSVSLHPPQAALDSAAPEGEAFHVATYSKAPLIGELAAQRPEGSYGPDAPYLPPCPAAGASPRPTNGHKQYFLFFTFRQIVGAACTRPVGVRTCNAFCGAAKRFRLFCRAGS